MTRTGLPEIPQAALKNNAGAERVERVWRRLDLDLARTPRARRAFWWWAPATATAIFGLGVFVGARSTQAPVDVRAVAEPRTLTQAPGAAPAQSPEAPAAAELSEPPRKHTLHPRSVPTTEAAEESFAPEYYGEPTSAAAPEALPSGPAEWERLAETGDFKAAKAALDREGGFDRVLGSASAGELMSLADIARSSGSREQAMLALKRVLTAHVSAPEAPIAAWTLGNLLEQAGDKAGAAEAYATYRRLSPAGDFAEDAAARQVDVVLSQGNLELGTRALEEYAQNFPKGRRLAELRGRLAALAGAHDPSAASASDPEEDDEAVEPAASEPARPPSAATREH